jgi:hypothetical protein
MLDDEEMERLSRLLDDDIPLGGDVNLASFPVTTYLDNAGCVFEGTSLYNLDAAKEALEDTNEVFHSDNNSASGKRSFHVRRGKDNSVEGGYVVITEGNSEHPTNEFPRGTEMPYVKMPIDERPSIRTSAMLHNLNEEQTLAFSLILDCLLQTEESDEQVLMLVMGHAGAGKSKIIGAVLWHLFQHDLSQMVVLTSYTWKAADLISTPANIGTSTGTLFGIMDMKPHLPVGQTKKCRQLLTPNIKMVINDEVFLNSQKHLHVSSRFWISLR